MHIPPSAWQGKDGCNEWLNVSAPSAIVDLHSAFVEAGAQILETNTFGATRIVLAEYGLEREVARINAAAVAHARRAIGSRAGIFVAGSVGPTTKLVSLGHIGRDELYGAYLEQVAALLVNGVDLLIIETCQDLLQVKTALLAGYEAMAKAGRQVPVMVSVTVERTGTMLVGTDIAAAAAALAPFPIFSFGLNCATGPADMTSHMRFLSQTWAGRISCVPNQGLPEVVDGRTFYPLTPGDYARQMRAFVQDYGVSVVGGCCGTTPEHTRRLVEALRGVQPGARSPVVPPSVASLYQSVDLRLEIPPFIIGEKTNANGSKKFRERLLADDFQGCLQIALEQEAGGAHALDVCSAYAGRDETRDMLQLVGLFAQSVKAPLVIDSTTPDCIEACLKRYPGRCIVNSINLEDGGKTLRRVCALLKTYGAAAVALTINEKGMAMTAFDKLETARRIHDIAVGEFGLRPSDLLFDPLTFTVGSGDATLHDAAVQTLQAIRAIKQELPGVGTILGVSNISFGLTPASRRILNSVFLHEAVAAGLDAAIVDAGKVLPLVRIAEADRAVCLNLLYDRGGTAGRTPLMTFIEHFRDADKAPAASDEPAEDARTPEQVLADMVEDGQKDGLEDQLTILLRRFTPMAIINQVLVPAMRHVGELFGRGEILLPFVLQSAEVMKQAVSFLEPLLDKSDARSATRVVLATVQGDVHDIGKNLVEIILSNNGYKVYNLGIKVPAETIIAKAREVEADLIGLSGLLVKSAIVMKESMPQYQAAGLKCPILLGGAALTPKFVAESCVPLHDAPVVYCADAFAGLKAAREYEEGRLTATVYHPAGSAALKPGLKNVEIVRDVPVPVPPFMGLRHVTGIDPRALYPLINEQALFRGRWGYRRARLSAAEYEALIAERVRPLYEGFLKAGVEDGLLEPKVAYGYFPCHSDGDTLVVRDGAQEHVFRFPRQAEPPFLCIADFFRTREEGGDVAGFLVATIGEAIGRRTHELYDGNHYHDYLMLHGFSVEVTDALAEYWHRVMRQELGIATSEPANLDGLVTQAYRGSRYGFGYPSCPDLEAHRPVFAMLRPEAIGVTLTESMEMVPEQSTSAIVAHHPQAKYFAV